MNQHPHLFLSILSLYFSTYFLLLVFTFDELLEFYYCGISGEELE